MNFTTPFEIKAPDAAGVFVGHGAIFDSTDLGGDSIQFGAFRDTLSAIKARGAPLPLLWSHDQSKTVGRFTTLREDAVGLYVEGKLTLETVPAKEAYALLRDRAVTGLSIGYGVPDGGSSRKGNTRLLHKIDLHEISLVAVPMHPDARIVEVKSLSSPDELVRALREGRPLQFEPASRRKVGPMADQLWALRGAIGANDPDEDLDRELARVLNISSKLKGH